MSDFINSPIIKLTDWSALEHAYGNAANIPDLWRVFIEEGDTSGDFANTICHQETVYSSTPVLVPLLLELAKSNHARSQNALGLLGSIMRSPGGVAFQEQLLAQSTRTRRYRNPNTGEIIERSAPSSSVDRINEEKSWIRSMKDMIQEGLDRWLSIASERSSDRTNAALYLLTGIALYSGSVEAEDTVRAAIERAGEDEEQTFLRFLLEELDDEDGDEEDDDDEDEDDEDDDDAPPR